MGKIIHSYNNITSLENLLLAWEEFRKGKRSRKDVQVFERNLMANIIDLHNDLQHGTYNHGGYYAFNISDPKPRNIHKATVGDCLLHHAIYRALYLAYDPKFIVDFYSCRKNKGTHKALATFEKYKRKVSKNNMKTAWVLKCDIKKFFATINHEILLSILKRNIEDVRVVNLLEDVIGSFNQKVGKGLPLGNLTSQLLVNIYMNELDQFIKHKIKASHYIRYADDFVILSPNRLELTQILHQIRQFLDYELMLELHPSKVSIATLASGIDFLGWVHFSKHKVVRTATKRRILKKLYNENMTSEAMQSYRGHLKHGNSHKLVEYIERMWQQDSGGK